MKALRVVRPMLGMPNDFDVWKAQKQADEALAALDALTPEDVT